MTQQDALDIAHGALMLSLVLSGPALAVILLVGILISVFQAVTQINEATLSFVPKVAAFAVVLVILGPWMLQTAVTYTTAMFSQLALVAR